MHKEKGNAIKVLDKIERIDKQLAFITIKATMK